MEALIVPGSVTNNNELLLTSGAKRVIELSVDEARRLNHQYLGTEHLLLALISEGKGIASKILIENSVTLEKARLQRRKLFGA